MAASDVEYNNLPADAKAKGEFQFLRKALAGAPNGIHQGIYVVTPSGKYLKKANVGWPSLDPEKGLQLLKEAVTEYRAMPRLDRLARAPLKNSDRSISPRHDVIPAPEWLKIRSTTRSYPFPGMELFDMRHPKYFKLDRLWLTPEEARSLIPSTLEIGEQTMLGKSVIRHLTQDCHIMLGCPPWWDETVKKAEIRSHIIAKKGAQYALRFTGTIHLDSDTQYNKSSYRGDLLGTAVWDEEKKQITQLKWVTLGERNRRVLRSNETKSKVKVTTVGAVFEIDPMRQNDHGLPPHRWHDGYSKAMQQRARTLSR
ncbi:MAG: hypothetical protein KJO79_10755 [Verrucomicrobiae bacterium]|nr:hypothetical protein [Verrucomicrobiae bacterium]NNJ87654.1 hypothetical protein [Akkermansiaceae bacterium]